MIVVLVIAGTFLMCWLADKGFDFIQTDWPLMVKMYLEGKGKMYRK